MAETKVSADASSFGLGAVIQQKAEKNLATLETYSICLSHNDGHRNTLCTNEKESLALTWACERFSMYLLGRSFTLETDHKPLISLLSTKNLDNLPPHILRFRLRLMRYNFNIVHVPGKALNTADALSRAPLSSDFTDSFDLQESAEMFISAVVDALPASTDRLQQISTAQSTDPDLQQVIKYSKEG